MENDHSENNVKRTSAFYFALILMFILFLLTLNTDFAQYSQHTDTGIPMWFFKILFPVDFIILAALVLIFFYRKIGVFLFPGFVLIHHLLYEFYLSTTLLSGLHLLFVYVGIGLLVIIPRWKDFK
jgi:hypothetical protein